MDKVLVKYENDKSYIKHIESEKEIQTSTAVEYGGDGSSFSSTDLLIAALGNCTLTTIDKIISRESGDINEIRITLDKKLSDNPKEIKSISMNIYIPLLKNDKTEKKINRAIDTCPVHKCLAKGTKINISLEWKPE